MLSRRRLVTLPTLLGGVAAITPRAASAADAEVTSDTASQFYDVRSPTGETIVTERRLVTTLGVSAYNLIDHAPSDMHAPEITFRARLRYDADYGASGATVDPTQYASLVPGFSQGPVDLMYGYVEGRRLLHGWLGFKLGRQYVVDSLGWWSFDGGEASVTTPYYVKAEVYGGLEERGGMPLSTPRYEADGVWRGDRNGYDTSLYPSFQPATIAPAVGVALESAGVTWIHGRLTYRRVWDTGASNTSQFASGLYTPTLYDGPRVSTERLGYAVDASWSDVGGVKAGIVYDVYNAEVTSIYGSLDAYLTKRLTLSADYDYYQPTFDADSIWNFFAGEPMNDMGLRANWDITDHLSVAGGGHVRIYRVQTNEFDPYQGASQTGVASPSPNYNPSNVGVYFPTNGQPFDEGFNASARWRKGATMIGLRGNGNFGDEGQRVGADLYGEHVFETRYVASLRTGLWQWQDKLQPDRDAVGFNYVAGVGYRFAPRSRAMFEWEHDMNRLVGQRFRLMLSLSVAVGK
jgi:hypothetical protein